MRPSLLCPSSQTYPGLLCQTTTRAQVPSQATYALHHMQRDSTVPSGTFVNTGAAHCYCAGRRGSGASAWLCRLTSSCSSARSAASYSRCACRAPSALLLCPQLCFRADHATADTADPARGPFEHSRRPGRVRPPTARSHGRRAGCAQASPCRAGSRGPSRHEASTRLPQLRRKTKTPRSTRVVAQRARHPCEAQGRTHRLSSCALTTALRVDCGSCCSSRRSRQPGHEMRAPSVA
jgi:hypothetical protein